MLTLRTVRTLCAAFDTVALTAIAAAISKSISRAKTDITGIPPICPSPANTSKAPLAAAAAATASVDLSSHARRTDPEVTSATSSRDPKWVNSEPALVRLKKERDPEKLFHLFRDNAHNPLVVENRFAFEDTVSRLAGARRFDLIEQLLEHQKALPQGRREGFVIRVIMLYGRAGMPDHALRTFQQMHLFGCRRTVKSLNATLRVLSVARRFDDFQMLLNEAPLEFGMTLDDISYNLIVKLLCDMGKLEAAYLAMVEMEKTGLKPDVVTYTTIMAASYKHNRREIGDGLWNLMVIKGCSPNLATYNVRVQYLINKWRAWQANHLVQKMVFTGIEPDELTYNLLIKGFCMVGDLEMAKRIFHAMSNRGYEPNAKVYQTMVHYFCEGGDFNLAFRFCKESMERNWFPSVDSISRLLEGLVKISKDRNAREIMKLVCTRVPSYSAEEIMALQVKLSPCRRTDSARSALS